MKNEIEQLPNLSSVSLARFKAIQLNQADDDEITSFIEDIKSGKIEDELGKPIGLRQLCHYFLTSETLFLHPRLRYQLVSRSHACFDLNLKQLCSHYANSSGLALYLLAHIDEDYYMDKVKKKETLQQAAALKNVNAMEKLYFEFFKFPRDRLLDPFQPTLNDTPILSFEEAGQYLLQAAELGSWEARVELFYAYLGKRLSFKVPIDLEQAENFLTMVLPDSYGVKHYEYHLSLLYEFGFRTTTQKIVADPDRAAALLLAAAKKGNFEARNRLETLAFFQNRKNRVPANIVRALAKITKQSQTCDDINLIISYVTNLDIKNELINLLSLLICQQVVCLPPVIFLALSERIASVKKDLNSLHTFNQFQNFSPLIESLVFPNSLIPTEKNCPHAEYHAYKLYKLGGEGTNEEYYLSTAKIIIKPDPKIAAHFLRRAAEHGHALALYKLGKKFIGRGDSLNGENYLQKAADKGHLPAMIFLANHYWEIFNVDKARFFLKGKSAIHWYSMARTYGWAETGEFQQKMTEFAAIQAQRSMTESTQQRGSFFPAAPSNITSSADSDDDSEENLYLLSRQSPTRVRY